MVQEIYYLDIRYLIRRSIIHIFHFLKFTTAAKINRLKPFIKSLSFIIRKNFCVCHYIDLYISERQEIMKGENQPFLSLINPYKIVSTQAISR